MNHITTPGVTAIFNWGKTIFLLLGAVLFVIVYGLGAIPDALDPAGNHFALTHEGKGALAILALAITWWISKALPVGVTAIAVGMLQMLFIAHPGGAAFGNFISPPILFICASTLIGMAFMKTGLIKRLVYRVLMAAGDRTVLVYLGSMVVIALLSHIMIYTAVVASVYPLLFSAYMRHAEGEQPTRFGKGLFIAMAYAAAAGSMITLPGAARSVLALEFFRAFAGREINSGHFSYYMLPLGWLMLFSLWGFVMICFRPQKKHIPEFREYIRLQCAELGAASRNEILTLVIAVTGVMVLLLSSLMPEGMVWNKTVVIVTPVLLLFMLDILDIHDLQSLPWNMILLFSGAISVAFCLWETGAARWLAVNGLNVLQSSNGAVIAMVAAFLALLMANGMANVVVLAVVLPVMVAAASYLKIVPDVLLLTILAAVGMPLMLPAAGAANTLVCESGQFTDREFFMYGAMASVLVIVVLALMVYVVWPMMGLSLFIFENLHEVVQ